MGMEKIFKDDYNDTMGIGIYNESLVGFSYRNDRGDKTHFNFTDPAKVREIADFLIECAKKMEEKK